MTKKLKFDFLKGINIVGKGERAFSPFPTNFSKTLLLRVVKGANNSFGIKFLAFVSFSLFRERHNHVSILNPFLNKPCFLRV